jgi:hypothetical protein
MAHQRLSPKTIDNYAGAVTGPLSQWAIEGGLTSDPLTSITSSSRFDALAQKIRELPIFVNRDSTGHQMYSSALSKYSQYLSEAYADDVEADIEGIIENPSLPETEKTQLVQARIGQGTFRQNLIAYWSGCAATGFKDTALLLASHIKPWKESTNSERLDKFNGFLLLPNLDKAFDAGLITFNEDGTIKMSPQLVQAELLGIHSGLSVRLAPEHMPYLAFHRNRVFRNT